MWSSNAYGKEYLCAWKDSNMHNILTQTRGDERFRSHVRKERSNRHRIHASWCLSIIESSSHLAKRWVLYHRIQQYQLFNSQASPFFTQASPKNLSFLVCSASLTNKSPTLYISSISRSHNQPWYGYYSRNGQWILSIRLGYVDGHYLPSAKNQPAGQPPCVTIKQLYVSRFMHIHT